jgi:hypothetical protein
VGESDEAKKRGSEAEQGEEAIGSVMQAFCTLNSADLLRVRTRRSIIQS